MAVAGTGGDNSPAGSGSGATSGSGGSASGASGVVVGTGNSSSGAIAAAGFDNGGLFADAAAVVPSSSPDAQSTSSEGAAPKSDAGSGIPGDGHSATITFGFWGLTATFTQMGTNVTVVVAATQGCPAGSHTMQIHGGFSCDNAMLMGPVWDGKRGDGISPLMCDATGHGMVTYTRSGADPTMNWTVADQNQKTDVSLHVILMDGRCAAFL
jgi:hypothetical protein